MKPDNFTIGHENDADNIYIVDYGLSKPYIDLETKVHIPFSDDKKLTGTARYASINTHLGYDQSRRDDLESLGYTLIYLAKGVLPWQGVWGATKKQRREKICTVKMCTSIPILCKGLPTLFSDYMKYCRSLKFEEAPDYYVLKKLITTYFSKSKFDVDFVFDWRKPNDKQIKEPQRSISSMMIPNIKVEIQKEDFLPEIVLKPKASCNMLNDVMNGEKEERK